MDDAQPRTMKTGGDPRTLPAFMALRDEMNKLGHPARPDVNWSQVEALSLSLFEINGVELQTGAWHTLARSQLARASGMNEGVSLICALLSHQWAQCWPQSVHSRVEIVSGLCQRLQGIFRTFTLVEGDCITLRSLAASLSNLAGIFTRQGIPPPSALRSLIQQVQSALARLDNSPIAEISSPQSLYVARQEPEVAVNVAQEVPAKVQRLRSFFCGVVSALVVGVVAFAGWRLFSHSPTDTEVISGALQPLPHTLTEGELSALKQRTMTERPAAQWIKQASAQLNALAALPPEWNIRYGDGLVAQANALWPLRPDAQRLRAQWQHQLALHGMSEDALTGWYDGMARLQQLTMQLNALDGQKGKYITVSELKSQVFAATQAFNKTVPVEEQLRQMSAQDKRQTIPLAQKLQAEQHLKQLIARYAAVTGGGSSQTDVRQ